jgi:RNA recognition motif-containing protein
MPTTLLLSNVPFDCSDDLLRQWIENQGFPVLNVTLIRDIVSGTSPSFAYIQFSDADIDEVEQTLHGQTLKNRTIRVSRVGSSQVAAERARSARL